MKNRLLFIFAFFLLSNTLFAQWFWQFPQPQGHNLSSVQFINGQTGFAVGVSGAFIKTSNGGLNWYRKTINPGFDLTSVFFINSTTGFVVQYSTTILKTVNAGENWTNTFVYSGAYFNSVFFVDDNTGFACGCSNIIFKTTNCGINWTSVTLPGGACFNSVHFPNPNTGYLLGNNQGKTFFYKTTNCGTNWTPLNFSVKKVYYSMFFVNPDTGFAGGDGNIIAKTLNGGVTWSRMVMPGGNQGTIKDICFVDANTGFCISNDSLASKIFKTTNGGDNWNFSYADSNFFAEKLSIKNGSGAAVGVCGRIFRTTDCGNNWISNNNGLSNGIGYLKFQNDLTGFTVHNTYYGLYKSVTTNGGVSWTPYGNGINAKSVFDVFFPDVNTGYAVGGNSNLYSRIYKTTDAGLSWTQQLFSDPRTIATVHFLDGNFGMAAGMQGLIIKTTNGGANWAIVNSGGPEWINKIILTDYNTGYVCNSGGYILKTSNGGNSWYQAAYLNGASLNEICFVNNYTGYTAYAGAGGGVAKTTNGGINWQTVLSGISAPSINFYNENTGFVSGYNGKIYCTTNGGAIWIDQSGLTTHTPWCFTFINPQIAYAVAGECLLKTTNVGYTFFSNNINEIPDKSELLQNYPNPFNPSTTIKWKLSKSGYLKLTVFNILGRVVKVLVNGKMTQGIYETYFDGSGLSSGIYFYKIETEYFTETKKMLLIK